MIVSVALLISIPNMLTLQPGRRALLIATSHNHRGMSDCYDFTYVGASCGGNNLSRQRVNGEARTTQPEDGPQSRANKDFELLEHRVRDLSVEPSVGQRSKRQRSTDHNKRHKRRHLHSPSLSTSDISPIPPPPTPSSRPLVTCTVEECWRKTWTYHPLKEAQAGGANREEAIVADPEEGGPDGRVKPLSKGRKPAWQSLQAGEERVWKGFRLDGATYWAGEGIVAQTRDGHCRGVIRLLFERRTFENGRRRYWCHVHWMKALAVGRDNELFLEDRRCEDIPVKHILRKISFVLLSPKQTRESVPTTSLFCRLVVESDHRLRDPFPSASSQDGCDGCRSKGMFERVPTVLDRSESVAIGEDTLHRNDTAMIDPQATGTAYFVGRIARFERGKQTVLVQLYKRHVDLNLGGYKDERRLVLTEVYESFPLDRLRGRCGVVRRPADISKYEMYPMFWCVDQQAEGGVLTPLDKLPACNNCAETRGTALRQNREFAKAGSLPFADYYSGAGGGVLSAKPFFHVISAVEMDHTACQTLKRNHARVEPRTRILEGRIEDLHQREVRRSRGETHREIYEPGDEHRPRSRRKVVPDLPAPGSVVGVMGGIPCQPHSRINMHKRPDDSRNDQLAWYMSEVDRLKPAYCVLENVPGYKDTRTDGTFADDGVQSYAIAAISMLINADYQCHVAILDSRAYGSPQNRSRLWIVAARRGLLLPKMPLPTHANPMAKSTRFSLEVGGWDETVSYVEAGTVGTGSFSPITVEDAINDLPAFEFLHPLIPAHDGIPRMEAVVTATGDKRVGYLGPAAYTSPPRTSYQSSMRQGQQVVHDHFTPKWSDMRVIQCHEALLKQPLPGPLQALSAGKGFATLLTSNKPGGKATRPVHYAQARTKTIAEDKRAMGFPDAYQLCGTAEERIAQLGNAWVVPMGQAIVKEIRNVIRQAWLEDNQPNDLQTWWRGKVEQSCAPLT